MKNQVSAPIKNFSRYLDIFYGIVPPVEEWEMRTQNCSIAINKNRIVAIGFNQKKTNPINLLNRKINSSGRDYSNAGFTCAEYSCLNRVRRKTNVPFENITLLNIRITRDFKLAMASPCFSCRALCSFLAVTKIYFTNDRGDFQKL